MNKKKLVASIGINSLIVLFEIYSGYLYISKNGLNFMQFYTEDSNVITMIACFAMAIAEIQIVQGKNKRIPSWIQFMKYLSAVCLTLTFLVVVFVLIPMQGGTKAIQFLLLDGSMLYHHLLCPILVVVSILCIDPMEKLPNKYPLYVLIPTIIYASALLVLNILCIVDGPYPFLRVYNQPIYVSAIWCVTLLCGTYIIALLLSKFVNHMVKQ